MKGKNYDIFISYKRKSLPTANNLYYRLTTRGYNTFFDLEEMGRDNFNVQLLNYIENAKDMFVILEEGSLDACKTEDWEKDWFCHEIAYALEKNKNIIPILIGNYKMPPETFFPDKLKDLSLKHAPEFNFSFFDEYLDKIIDNEFLLSTPNLQEKVTSVFKFYSNQDCQVFKEGKLVCSLEGMSDKPYYLPVSRKGDYRFKIVNSTTDECKLLNEVIDVEQEKNIEIKWNNRLNLIKTPLAKGKGYRIALAVILLLLAVIISIKIWIIPNDPTPVLPNFTDTTVSACTPVDLGLPSGTLWGDRNVGAKSPSDYGHLYAWGEVETKVDYSANTYSEQTKPSQKITTAKHDAAIAELGGKWVMPTEEQYKELILECTWSWKKINGHYGYDIVGRNGNRIFLPASGWIRGTSVEYQNQYGYYWTSERTSSPFARSFMFPKDGKGIVGNGYLHYGRNIRAVCVSE